MNENRYCVYLHKRKDNNEVFYVGQGTVNRPYSTSRKLKAWKITVEDAGGFYVDIIKTNITKNEALILELEKIEEYKDTIVNISTSSSMTKDLNYNLFNDKFYIDETSPSGLRFKTNIYAGKNYNSLIHKINDVAGSRCSDGSWSITHNRKPIKAHRVVFLLIHKTIDLSMVIDHIDGNNSNNSIGNLRQVSSSINRRNLKIDKRNTSGVTGIAVSSKNTYRASVLSLDGVRLERSFSISKYGEQEAFRLACEWRTSKIKELNENGAGYTDRHGT